MEDFDQLAQLSQADPMQGFGGTGNFWEGFLLNGGHHHVDILRTGGFED
jgi:hypothetical protein